MTHDRPTSEVLHLAADLIERHGWEQGPDAWSGCGGGICIDEAIARALGFDGCNVPGPNGIWPSELRATAPVLAVEAHLERTRRNEHEDLYEWNDHPKRTATEVVEVLRATALIESARERTNGGPRPDLDDLRANLDEPNLRAALAAVSA